MNKINMLCVGTLIVLCLLFICGCGKITDDQTLCAKGIEKTTLLGEMVQSETYLKLIGVSDNAESFVAYDYDVPRQIFKITFPSDFLEELAKISEINFDVTSFDSLSENLQDAVKKQVNFQTVITYINSNNNISEILMSKLLQPKSILPEL